MDDHLPTYEQASKTEVSNRKPESLKRRLLANGLGVDSVRRFTSSASFGPVFGGRL